MLTNSRHTASNRAGRSALLAALFLLLALLLSGCGAAEPEAVVPEETPEPTYTLRYYLGNKLLQTQTLTVGQHPTHLDLSLPGLSFAGWQNSFDALVEPEKIAISENVDYHARIYPVLDSHVPYLFPDADGFLRPDEALTYKALSAAIRALAAPEAGSYLPSLPVSNDAMDPDAFREVLLALFPSEQVDAALGARTPGDPVLRRDCAVILNMLLGRDRSESVTLRRAAMRAPDCAGEDAWDLMEASVSHALDAWGEAWDDCDVPGAYAPGFLALDGRLYLIGADGTMQTDTQQGSFTFGPDGVYTSGDAVLDGYTTEILSAITRDNPGAEPIDLLRAAYEYTRDSFTYFRKPAFVYGQTGWELEAAVEMLEGERGNCYNYAAVFWALARGLGYDAHAYSGVISDSPHGWVEITIDDVLYLFDPELEMAARLRGQYYQDRFMMTKLAASAWGNYRHP